MGADAGRDFPEERGDLSCPEAGCPGMMELRTSRYGPFYGCSRWPDCDATHGAHPNGAPLGIPADSETKEARIMAHEQFDRLWKGAETLPCYDLPDGADEYEQAVDRIRGAARGRAYRWLAATIGITVEQAHIGRMDRSQALLVRDLCRAVVYHRSGPGFIRRWAKWLESS